MAEAHAYELIRREGVMQLKNKLLDKFRVDLEKSVQQNFVLRILWRQTSSLPTTETSRRTGSAMPKEGRSESFQCSRHVRSCEMWNWSC